MGTVNFIEDHLDTLRGPNGGNLLGGYHRERKIASLSAEIDPSGELGLHRFEKDDEIAAVGIKNEQPWHRMAAYLLVAGTSLEDVANAANVTKSQIQILKAQVWFQELLVTIANQQGRSVLGIIQGEAMSSVQKLVQLRDSAESERVQLAAAQVLLEQAHGKPVQKNLNISQSIRNLSPEEEMSEIEQELAALRARKVPAARAATLPVSQPSA